MKTSQAGSEKDDGYTKAIDFSNACREFYINRKKLTENFKEDMEKHEKRPPDEENKNQSPVSLAMDKLKREMVRIL